jgi:predicted amidohydrolase
MDTDCPNGSVLAAAPERAVPGSAAHAIAGPSGASYTRVVAEIVVATCTYRGTHDLEESLERHHRLIEEAADAGASLVVFPEISLHGYPSIEMTEKRLRATFESSECVPDGPSVRELAQHAVDRAVHVVYGLNEAGREPGVIYNTAVLTGPAGHIGSYRTACTTRSARSRTHGG